MKLGFLILAHRYPAQLVRLIEALLLVDESKIYIHVDQKNTAEFQSIINQFKSNARVVFIEETYKVYWGSYNQILATLALIKAAVKSNSEHYFMLLSGQDFLIKKPSELVNFFKINQGSEYMVHFKLPDVQWQDGGLNRLGNYHLNFPKHPWLTNKINAAIGKLQTAIKFKRRSYFQQYGGSNWFNLSIEALTYIVNYVNQHPVYLKTFKYSLTADEIFIQSILINSEFKSKIVPQDLRYTNWSTGPEYPKILRETDFEELIHAQSKFFARKFDATKDSIILDKLKAYIES